MSNLVYYPKHVTSKSTTEEMTSIDWNPRMDLLAVAYKIDAVTCSRLLSLQKVWEIDVSGKIAATAWRPDGKVLAIASNKEEPQENVCILYDVENGKKINTINLDSPITSINWFQYRSMENKKDLLNKRSAVLQNILKSSKLNALDQSKGLASSDIENLKLKSRTDVENAFSHQLAHEQADLNLLMISTVNGYLSFYPLGLFYLGAIQIYEDLNRDSDEKSSKIVLTHMSSCSRYITSILCNKHIDAEIISMKIIRLDFFHRRSKEILRVSKMYAKITDELEYLNDTMNAITTSWADVLAGLDNKLSSYCSRKSKNQDDSQSGYTFLSADELLQLLVIGFPSDNLEKFLADMSDKGLKKLNNAIEQTCLRVQNLIVKNAQKCCYHLHADLNLLRGMALWKDRYKEIGLNDSYMVASMRSVGSLMLKLTELQQVIDHSLRSTKSFFRWLISIACRMSGEQNTSIVPNDFNKTTQQDIQLITDFILENFDYNTSDTDLDISRNTTKSFANNDTAPDNKSESSSLVYANRPTCSNFTLEQVGQYLKNEPLSRLKHSFSKPNSNFWIDYFKNRTELTQMNTSLDKDDDGSTILLLYPHNELTSLIQEHEDTCKSIKVAFQSIHRHFSYDLNMHDFTFVNLKDFVKNGPVNRVRVETNIEQMLHFTLFQTKSEPVIKQYLMVQSLTKKTFKLFSIRFQVQKASSTGGPATTKGVGNKSAVVSPRASTTSSKTHLVISDAEFYEIKEDGKLFISFLLIDTIMNDTIILQIETDKIMENYSSQDRLPKDAEKMFRNEDLLDRSSAQVRLNLDLYTELAEDRKFEHNMMVKKIKGTVGKNMYSSSERGVIAFTSCENKELHLYELESAIDGVGLEIIDDKVERSEKIDESHKF